MSEASALENLNAVDLGILGVVGASALFGAITGMLGLSVRIIAIVLGLYLSYRYGGDAQQWIAENVLEGQDAIAWGVGYLGTFMVVLLVVGFIGKQMRHVVKASNMGGLDITGGAALGALRGGLIVSLIAVPASFTPVTVTETWKTSTLLPYVFAGIGKVSEWSSGDSNSLFTAINDQLRTLSENNGQSEVTHDEMPSDLTIDGDPEVQSEPAEADQGPETLLQTQADPQKKSGEAKADAEQQDLNSQLIEILNNAQEQLGQ